MGTSWVAVSINNITTRASREMTSRKNINIFDLNRVNVAKHWHVAGEVFAISDCLVLNVIHILEVPRYGLWPVVCAVADLRGGSGGGGVRTPPHLSWISIPSPGTLPPRTLFITNVKFRTWSSYINSYCYYNLTTYHYISPVWIYIGILWFIRSMHIHPIHRYFIVVLANNQKFVGIGLFSYLKCRFIWAKW